MSGSAPLFDLGPFLAQPPATPTEVPASVQGLFEVLLDGLDSCGVAAPDILAWTLVQQVLRHWGAFNFYLSRPEEGGFKPRFVSEVETWAGEALRASGMEETEATRNAARLGRKLWACYGGGFVDFPKGYLRILRDRLIASRPTGTEDQALELCREFGISRRQLGAIKRNTVQRRAS